MFHVEYNEANMSVKVIADSEITYENHLEPFVLKFKNKGKEWLNSSDFEEFDPWREDVEGFVEDVEDGLYDRHKTICLIEVENEFDKQKTQTYHPNPFDTAFLENVVIKFISEEWAINKKLLLILKDY